MFLLVIRLFGLEVIAQSYVSCLAIYIFRNFIEVCTPIYTKMNSFVIKTYAYVPTCLETLVSLTLISFLHFLIIKKIPINGFTILFCFSLTQQIQAEIKAEIRTNSKIISNINSINQANRNIQSK